MLGLNDLVNKAICIIRETRAEFKNPVLSGAI